MSFPSRSLGLVAATTALVSLAPVVGQPYLDEPAFGPAAGASLTKTFTYGGEFTLDDVSALVDGLDIAEMFGGFEITVDVQNTVTITDTYIASADGHPTELVRSFDSLEGAMSVAMATDLGDEDQDVSSSSELEGLTVVFAWDADEEAYGTSFEGDEGDDDLLAGLVEDMDLRAFLPTGEVAVDDTWEVDLERLGSIAIPGGNLKLLPDDLEEGDPDQAEAFEDILGGEYGEYLADLLEGSCVCTYKGTTDEGLGEINIALEIGSAADLTDMLTELIEDLSSAMGEAPPVTIDLADLNLDLEGEGVLLWNLELGHIASFELSADTIIAADIGLSGDMGGQTQTLELSAEMSGTYSYSIETEE